MNTYLLSIINDQCPKNNRNILKFLILGEKKTYFKLNKNNSSLSKVSFDITSFEISRDLNIAHWLRLYGSVAKNTFKRDRMLYDWNSAHKLILPVLPVRWLVLKMGYIGSQDLVSQHLVSHMERPIHSKFYI